MSRLPGLPALRVFDTAARHLSFTSAADELGVTPAAVSNQIRGLEDQLGLRLFWRTSRRMGLTSAGETLFDGTSDAFAVLRRTLARLRSAESHAVSVTTSPSFAAKWLVPRLDAFRRLHPGVDVRIDVSERVLELGEGGPDIGIRFGNGDYPGHIADRLFEEFVFPVCSPALLSGPHPLRTPGDLRHHTLIHLDWQAQGYTWPDWRSWLLAAGVQGIDAWRGISLSSFALVGQAAIEGHGVALGNSSLVSDDLEAGRLVKPFALTLRAPELFTYYLVTPRALAERPLVAAFRAWVLSETSEGREKASGQPAGAFVSI